MIRDTTIDEALIEILRTKRALEALRRARKTADRWCTTISCGAAWKRVPFALGDSCAHCNGAMTVDMSPTPQHSAAKRASMDLTRKLADLRAGR